jgi:hypothetical protein
MHALALVKVWVIVLEYFSSYDDVQCSYKLVIFLHVQCSYKFVESVLVPSGA